MNRERRSAARTIRRYASIAAFTLLMLVSTPSHAADKDGSKGLERHPVTRHRSKHLWLHTDLDRQAARATLDKLESRLRIVSRYWALPLKAPIECFLIEDLRNWPVGRFDDDQARVVLDRVGGFAKTVNHGGSNQARLYATTVPGVAAHELVHAYCAVTFERPVPDWYGEGMAEYFANLCPSCRGLQSSEEALRVLQDSKQRSINEIVNNRKFTAAIANSIRRAAGRTSKGWLSSDDRALQSAKESYYWSWALCHFLAQNTNYRDRFQEFGTELRRGVNVTFDDYFTEQREQLDVEFSFFASNITRGFQGEAASWRWPKEKDVTDGPWSESRVRISSNRGYQSANVDLAAGNSYEFTTTGKWRTNRQQLHTHADGQSDRAGRLMAILVTAQGVTAPFDIRRTSTITACDSGHLFLRCHDHWDSLHDNDGCMTVLIRPAP